MESQSHSRSVSGEEKEGGNRPPRRGRPRRERVPGDQHGDHEPGKRRRKTGAGGGTTTPPVRKRKWGRRDVAKAAAASAAARCAGDDDDDDDDEVGGEELERRERERRRYRGAAATRHDLLCFRRWQRRSRCRGDDEGKPGRPPPPSSPSNAGGGAREDDGDSGTEGDDDDGIDDGDSEDERLRILIAAAAEEEWAGEARAGGVGGDPEPAPTWSDMFVRLAAYKSEHGDCLVLAPGRCEGRHADLSRWVREQRVALSSPPLGASDDGCKDDADGGGEEEAGGAGVTATSLRTRAGRREALRSLGFVFNLRDDPWQERYSELVAYHREHGHITINTNTTRLGEWLKRQRMAYKKFRVHGGNNVVGWHYIDQRRIDRLNALGMDWKLRDRTDWRARYDELCDFRCRHGHCVVPQKYEENRGLAEWVTRMRYQHGLMVRGRHSQLNEERVRLLNEVGFQWKVIGGGGGGRGGKRRVQKKIADEKEEGGVQV